LTWKGSHHDLAMQAATPQTVLGDFEEATFGGDETGTRFFRRGDRFLIQTPGRDGKQALFEVPYVFGVDPLQQLLVTLPGGRLQAFPIAWDARAESEGGQRWFHLEPEDAPEPGDPFHWTGVYQTWNHQCASCHSTALERGYDEATDAYTTTWAEINVGCQACHGGGAAHVAWAEGDGGVRPTLGVGREAEIDACGPCHSRRSPLAPEPVPGGPFLDGHLLANPLPPLYHADGQIREEVYVLGSFLQSRMHEAGVRCSDCHDPHRAATRLEGNALCLGCHGGAPPARFAARLSTAVRYDAAEHHHHETGSAGAQCINCHMPAQLYMGVDARRDHAFQVPRPALSARLGAPDACTSCHTDRDSDWAIASYRSWGIEPDEAGTLGAEIASGDIAELERILTDLERPAIERAAAMEWLGRAAPPSGSRIEAALTDEAALVRVYAARSAVALAPGPRVAAIGSLLDDPRRAVRLEAARALSDVPAATLGDRAAQRDQELAELTTLLDSMADTPAARLQLGELAERRGQDPEHYYRGALFLDPGLAPAARHTARRLAARNQLAAGEPVLRRALEVNPDSGPLLYDLGLLLAETEQYAEAATVLAQAAERMPAEPRIFYNLGLVLELLERPEQAEVAWLNGLTASPDNGDLLYALVALHANRGQPDRALPFAERLVGVAPSDETRDLLRRVQQATEARR
jgi:predicted CXXCH cytochrome family protein